MLSPEADDAAQVVVVGQPLEGPGDRRLATARLAVDDADPVVPQRREAHRHVRRSRVGVHRPRVGQPTADRRPRCGSGRSCPARGPRPRCGSRRSSRARPTTRSPAMTSTMAWPYDGDDSPIVPPGPISSSSTTQTSPSRSSSQKPPHARSAARSVTSTRWAKGSKRLPSAVSPRATTAAWHPSGRPRQGFPMVGQPWPVPGRRVPEASEVAGARSRPLRAPGRSRGAAAPRRTGQRAAFEAHSDMTATPVSVTPV